MNQQILKPAIEQGKVSVATIDDKVRRILRTALRFGWLDRDQTVLSIPRYNLQGREVALNAAREGITLLKNDGGLLPLSKSKIKSISIIGPGAYPAVHVGGGSAEVCQRGKDIGRESSPWVVCAADERSAWVSADSSGFYHLDLICQELGYAAAGAFGGTCGNVCGYCEGATSCDAPGQRIFDGYGDCDVDEWGRRICYTVQWECVN